MADVIVTAEQLQVLCELRPVLSWQHGSLRYSAGTSWFLISDGERIAYRLRGREALKQLHDLIAGSFATHQKERGIVLKKTAKPTISGRIGQDTVRLHIRPGLLAINYALKFSCEAVMLRELCDWLRLCLGIDASHQSASHERYFHICHDGVRPSLQLSYRASGSPIAKVPLSSAAKTEELGRFLLTGCGDSAENDFLSEITDCARVIRLESVAGARVKQLNLIGSVCGYGTFVSRIDLLLLAADLQLLASEQCKD